MPQEPCAQGAELLAAALQADAEFKSGLVRFFSNAHRDEQEMLLIEALGARHREFDEAFQKHRRFCDACSRVPAAAPLRVE